MLLCIDIGNTNTVLATFDGDKLVHNWRVKRDARNTAGELGLMFRGLLAGDNVEITGVAACSTVPAALRSLRTMLGRYYGELPNVIVEPGVKTGAQHAGRARPLRRAVDRGRLRHHHQLRRDQREGRVPRRGVRAGHRDLLR